MTDFDVTEEVLHNLMHSFNNGDGTSHAVPPDAHSDDVVYSTVQTQAQEPQDVVVRIEREDRDVAWGIRMTKDKASGGFVIASVDPDGPSGERGAAALVPGSAVQAINGHDLSTLPKAQLKGILSEAYVLDFSIVVPVTEPEEDSEERIQHKGAEDVEDTGKQRQAEAMRSNKRDDAENEEATVYTTLATPDPVPAILLEQADSSVEAKEPPRRKLVRSGSARSDGGDTASDVAAARSEAPPLPPSPRTAARLAEVAAVRTASPPAPPTVRPPHTETPDQPSPGPSAEEHSQSLRRRNSGPKQYTVRLSRESFDERWGITLHADGTTTPSVCRIVSVGPTGKLHTCTKKMCLHIQNAQAHVQMCIALSLDIFSDQTRLFS